MYELIMTNIVSYILVVAVVTWWGWRILEWIWFKPKRMENHLRTQGFKGNPYRVLFGDLKDCNAITKQNRTNPISISDDIVPRLVPFTHKIINTYGKKTFMWFGNIPRVHITEPDLMKEVLSKNFNYIKPKTNPFIKLLIDGLSNHEHDQWIKHRKIINPVFRMERIKLMVPAFHVSCLEMISAWEKELKVSKEVDVWPYLYKLTADVISRAAFGSSYEEGRKIFQLLTLQANIVIPLLNELYIPGWRFLPTKRNMRMKKIAKQLEHLLINVINKRVHALKNGEKNNQDLLTILLESNFNGKQDGKLMVMTMNEVIQECKLFYFAGQETTATLLLWTMVLLAQHQEWQHRAREEVCNEFGKEGKPNFDGLNRLKIVTMIINEVLRLYPPVAELTRITAKDMKLGESLHLQAGTTISLPIVLFHHDKEMWGDDAKEFKPERFANGISNATKCPVSYFPFSCGPRVCIGQNFTLVEAKMVVTMILQRFSFELSPTYAHAPCPVATTQPQFGAPLIMRQL
ncbi:cytochrome P450 CYP72A219-like [Impatiens glandulifera]|uniref:cytochrome P450 CYP72A219-like n=1 Tax=Impatiens glandulifera TaxID=253017 RepID=UPI001FB117DB|nr:cytochrome P450 CYP72A219-like [Impatiens glandulifera]